MNTNSRFTVASLAALIVAVTQPAITMGADAAPAAADAAETADANAGASDSATESVIVTGTRETNVKARDSVAPIDVLPASALQATGATNLRYALERALPSLNHAAFAGTTGRSRIRCSCAD
jgi:iron complex outermembrane receptor protein